MGVSLRNALYQVGLLRSVRFDLPVISVGNLSVGGTGKSPHIEYLLRWLDEYLQVGVLSRGYGRKTYGFREVQPVDDATEVGDEPLQFKRKFRGIPVTVSESRALGIPQMLKSYPNLQCILLDDAFQHLAVKPGLTILLTEHSRPFTRDWLLPSGRLREWRAAYRRADIIVVTKTPASFTNEQRMAMLMEINPFPRQRVYFSRYQYGTPYELFRQGVNRALDLDTDLLLVSAIANTDYLLSYLGSNARSVHTIEHEDHHYFNEADLSDILRRFSSIDSTNKVLITTEKDATRLDLHRSFFVEHGIPVVVLPITVEWLGADERRFQEDIKRFLLDFKV
jgi:tetraacyldisaccharide 4'-kinase